MDTAPPLVYPLADPQTTAKLFSLVNQAISYNQLTKGIGECVKLLNKTQAKLVILAADAEPLEIIMHIPQLCEQNNVAYCFVSSKAALGRAAGLDRGCVACAIKKADQSQLDNQIQDIIQRVESLFI